MLSIKRIEAYLIELPLVRPFVVSFGRMTHTTVIVLKIYNDSDLYGYGESSVIDFPIYKPEYAGSVWTVLNDLMLPHLMGKSFDDPAHVEKSLSIFRGNYFAKAAISMALHDLYAKEKNQSVIEILGGTQKTLTMSRTVSLYDDPLKAVEEAQKYYEESIRWIKLKICPGKDIKNLQSIMSSLPDDTKFMVDANASYKYSQETVSLFQEMQKMGVFCIEQPLAWNDIVFHARLQKELETSLALDESLDCLSDLDQAIDIFSCKAINIKLARVGGFSEALKIEEKSVENNLAVWVGGMMESPVGFYGNIAMATRAGCLWPLDFFDSTYLVEGFFDYFQNDLYEILGDKIQINFQHKGLGLTLDEKSFFKKQKAFYVHKT